jgi:hypothetical protein
LPQGVQVTLDAFTAPPRHPRRYRINTVCFQCNEVGHIRSECSSFRTKMCHNWQAGYCRLGSSCTFAHGEHELRRRMW